MALLMRIRTRFERRRSAVAAPDDERLDQPPAQRPIPSRENPVLRRPEPTPSMRRLGNVGGTAGTPTYRAPGGTPSTERLHNPPHPGR